MRLTDIQPDYQMQFFINSYQDALRKSDVLHKLSLLISDYIFINFKIVKIYSNSAIRRFIKEKSALPSI